MHRHMNHEEEQKVICTDLFLSQGTLACAGTFNVGLSVLTSYGLASAFGLLYGPMHSSLPFLLLGLGIDDMFVIVQSFDNLTKGRL